MSQKEETKFRARIRPHLDDLPNSWWESIQQKAIRGTPDILGVVNGYFIALELKTSLGKIDPLQAHKLSGIVSAGGYAYIVTPDNWESVFNKLQKLAGVENHGHI